MDNHEEQHHEHPRADVTVDAGHAAKNRIEWVVTAEEWAGGACRQCAKDKHESDEVDNREDERASGICLLVKSCCAVHAAAAARSGGCGSSSRGVSLRSAIVCYDTSDGKTGTSGLMVHVIRSASLRRAGSP